MRCVTCLSEKGADPLRRGPQPSEIDLFPKGLTPFRIGSQGHLTARLGALLAVGFLCAAGVVGDWGPKAFGQFGGYQQMTLDKIRRQQAAHSRRQRPTPSPSHPVRPPRPIVKNYYISPYYTPYYYSPYSYYGWGGTLPGYGYYGNWPYPQGMPGGPILVQPQVQVNPLIVAPEQGPQAPGQQAAGRQAVPPAAAADVAAAGQAAEEEILRRVAVLKPSTEAGRAQAQRLIASGDREFAAQQYRRAAANYRNAIGQAPDDATAHLRAGHAYTATGDYALAVTYFAMGLELAKTTQRAGFALDALYQEDQAAKQRHLERLAEATLNRPEDGGLLFLTGIMLHYDGKPLQARDYFRRAAELPGQHRRYASMFLPAAPRAAPPPLPPADR